MQVSEVGGGVERLGGFEVKGGGRSGHGWRRQLSLACQPVPDSTDCGT
jgi:hypothetical protein